MDEPVSLSDAIVAWHVWLRKSYRILSFIKYMGLGDKLQKYYYTNDDTPSLFWYRNDNVS